MSSKRLPLPTRDAILEAGVRFDSDDRYGPADRILSCVFLRHPRNEVFDHVLLKVTLLNSLYNTNILAFWAMAQHIHKLKIDPVLAECDTSIVDRIADLTVKGRRRRNYSFATKYCSWHRPFEFPIYDRLVSRVLGGFRDQYGFAAFTNADLQDYPKYKRILSAFREHFGLEGFTFKEIDKFLWFTSKDQGTA